MLARGKGAGGAQALVLTAFVVGWATVCNAAVEGLQRLGLGYYALPEWLDVGPFAVGTLVMSLLLTLLLCLTGRPWWSAGLLLFVSVFVGIANAEKLHLRFEPLYPGDVLFAGQGGSLLEMLGSRSTAGCVLVVAAMPCVVFLIQRRVRDWFPRVNQQLRLRRTRRVLVYRGVGILVCLLVVVDLGHFEDPGNPTRWLYARAGASWDAPAQAVRYLDNGFIAGSLSNLQPRAMEAPRDYSERTMRALLAKYTADARRINGRRDPSALDHLNVVVVLSESFGGTRHVLGAAPIADPIPFTHRLQEKTTSGRMLSQGFGGGTANIEFEALTGLSMSQLLPSMTYPYSMLIAHKQHFPSAVEYFNALDFASVAIHPYRPGFYSRDRVYPAFGFDRFVSASDLHDARGITPQSFISDESTFEEVTDQIAEHTEPVFLHVVTMQNHPAYDDIYPDPVKYSGLTGRTAAEAGNYARGLAHTDAAVQGLLDRLDRSAEPTAVVFFGDHQPGFWPQHVWQTSGYRAMHQTPFWIWSNLPHQRAEQMPTTSPIYFLPTLLDQANAPIPPFYALLEQMRAYLPAMDAGLMINADDQETTEAALPPPARALLDDYRLVEYDLTDGKGYIAQALFQPPAAQ